MSGPAIIYISLLKLALDGAWLATNDVEMEGEEGEFNIKEILDLESMDQ